MSEEETVEAALRCQSIAPPDAGCPPLLLLVLLLTLSLSARFSQDILVFEVVSGDLQNGRLLMGHLVSRHWPSDAASVEPRQRGLDEEDRDGRAQQGVECCVQGPCPLHPPIPQTRPLLLSALRGSVPCLHTRHLLPRSIYPGGYLGRIEPDAVPWQCVPPNFTNIGSHHNFSIIAQIAKPSAAIVKPSTF